MPFCPSLALQFRSQRRHRKWHRCPSTSPAVLNERRFATSRPDLARQRCRLRFRKVCDARGAPSKPRWTPRKIPHDHHVSVIAQHEDEQHSSTKILSPVDHQAKLAANDGPDGNGPATRAPAVRRSGKQPVRTKWVWLWDWAKPRNSRQAPNTAGHAQSGPLSFDISWTDQFHSLTRDRRQFQLDLPVLEPMIKKYASLDVGNKSTHLAWMHVPDHLRLSLWKRVMLWCLQKSPKRALKLLLATMRGERFRPPRHIVGDCLQHLSQLYLHRVINPDRQALHNIYHLTAKYVRGGRNSERLQSVPDQVVYLLLKNCRNGKVMSLLRLFDEERVQLHANTLLHALTRCLDMGNVTLSLRLLRAVSRSGIGMHRDQVMQACVRLIRARFDVRDQFQVQTRILTEVLKMGVRPNIQLYNAILLNSTEAGHIDLAWRMFDLAEANHLEPDNITYRILLQGAWAKEGHRKCRWLINELRGNPEITWDDHLKADVLYGLSKSSQPAYPAMLGFYSVHWSMQPLEELGLCSPGVENSTELADEFSGILPPENVLGQMISAYVKEQQDHGVLLTVYNRFRDLVRQNNPVIAPVARTDHVANAFMMSFRQSARTLSHCTVIVKNMIDDSKPSTTSAGSNHGSTIVAAPSVRTWSILAGAFFQHRQKRAAEKVLDVMRERGMTPDQALWHTMISGHSAMQNVHEAVDALRRMHAAGYRANTGTLNTLNSIDDRELLFQKLNDTLVDGNSGDLVNAGAKDHKLQDEMTVTARTLRIQDSTKERWKHLQQRYQELDVNQ